MCCILFFCIIIVVIEIILYIYFVHFFSDFSFSMQVKRIETWLNDDKILLFITLCRLNGVVLVVFHRKILTWCTAKLRPMQIRGKMNFCGRFFCCSRNYFVLSFLWLIIVSILDDILNQCLGTVYRPECMFTQIMSNKHERTSSHACQSENR